MLEVEVLYDTKFYDKFTKLLAEENISRTVKNVRTAYFDLNSREVVIPSWHEDLSDVVRKFLHSHEVSHARYTPVSDWHNFIQKYGRVASHYLNVVEDARIDQIMTSKFQGLRLVYVQAYSELFEYGFFGSTDWDKLNEGKFIDRFNIESKMRSTSKILIQNQIEADFVSRIDELKSFSDAIKLALDIFEYDVSDKTNDDITKIISEYTPDDTKNTDTILEEFDNIISDVLGESYDEFSDELADNTNEQEFQDELYDKFGINYQTNNVELLSIFGKPNKNDVIDITTCHTNMLDRVNIARKSSVLQHAIRKDCGWK